MSAAAAALQAVGPDFTPVERQSATGMRAGAPRGGRRPRRQAEPEYTGQDKARLRKVCDYLIDSEDELLYLVREHPSLQYEIDQVVGTLMRVTRLAHE